MSMPANTPARMRSNARVRRMSSAPGRRHTRRAGVIAIVLLSVAAGGLTYAATADAATVAPISTGPGLLPPPLEPLRYAIDALLDPLLPYPDTTDHEDQDGDGDGYGDRPEVNPECSPEPGACSPGPYEARRDEQRQDGAELNGSIGADSPHNRQGQDEPGGHEESYRTQAPLNPVPDAEAEHGHHEEAGKN